MFSGHISHPQMSCLVLQHEPQGLHGALVHRHHRGIGRHYLPHRCPVGVLVERDHSPVRFVTSRTKHNTTERLHTTGKARTTSASKQDTSHHIKRRHGSGRSGCGCVLCRLTGRGRGRVLQACRAAQQSYIASSQPTDLVKSWSVMMPTTRPRLVSSAASVRLRDISVATSRTELRGRGKTSPRGTTPQQSRQEHQRQHEQEEEQEVRVADSRRHDIRGQRRTVSGVPPRVRAWMTNTLFTARKTPHDGRKPIERGEVYSRQQKSAPHDKTRHDNTRKETR